MVRDSSYPDLSPRAERISKLFRKLDRVSLTLRETKYENPKAMLNDLVIFESLEKEIQIQKSYQYLEENY
jgi:hypothetical protein